MSSDVIGGNPDAAKLKPSISNSKKDALMQKQSQLFQRKLTSVIQQKPSKLFQHVNRSNNEQTKPVGDPRSAAETIVDEQAIDDIIDVSEFDEEVEVIKC